MPALTGMPLHIDMEKYLRMPGVVRAEFDGWLNAELLTEKGCIELTLGEGCVTVLHHEYDEDGKVICDHDDTGALVARIVTKTYPVKTMPPASAFE